MLDPLHGISLGPLTRRAAIPSQFFVLPTNGSPHSLRTASTTR
jgi:hypothetical protein